MSFWIETGLWKSLYDQYKLESQSHNVVVLSENLCFTSGFARSQSTTPQATPTAVPNYSLMARFSMGGLRGGILFLQREKNQPLEIKVEMDAFSGEGDFGIYSNPMIYHGNAKDSCNSDIVGSQVPNGNLTKKHGPFTFKMALTNDKLKAYGRESILGNYGGLEYFITLALAN